MLLAEDKIKPAVYAVAAPFSAAAASLLAVLAAAEILRPGFVSLFLDLRLAAGAALIFWGLAAWSESGPERGWLSRAAAVGLAAAAALFAWKLAAPYGRLGLAVFVAGLVGLAVVALSAHLPDDES